MLERVYDSMARHLQDADRVPGVEDAFAPGTYCMERYIQMKDAYDRLCVRLGVVDEDSDVETIINCMMDIEQELCFRMYRYGAMYGMESNIEKS